MNDSSSNDHAVDWNDPSLPPGDAPPLPRWRLPASIITYLVFVGFLVTMVILRMRATPF